MDANGNGKKWLRTPQFSIEDVIKFGPYLLILAGLIAVFKDVPGDIRTIKREGATKQQVNGLIHQVNKNNAVTEQRLEAIERRVRIASGQQLKPVVVYRYLEQKADDTETEPEWEWEK